MHAEPSTRGQRTQSRDRAECLITKSILTFLRSDDGPTPRQYEGKRDVGGLERPDQKIATRTTLAFQSNPLRRIPFFKTGQPQCL